ncbi:hypothetical protein [Kitasatospora sp. MBT66]|uniref:hypothetical protein n=1 Tax=Kitasatospora sp. MBT66 TaxID=1444769 RepID=UPI0005B9D66E|nr:hypothetical protein [Kitasatospora sp. MBT66]
MTTPAPDPQAALRLHDLAGLAVARRAMWQLACRSGDEERIVAARADALPPIRDLIDAQLEAGLITSDDHAKRMTALEAGDATPQDGGTW